MNRTLLSQAKQGGADVSGSLLAVSRTQRLAAADELWRAGAWVHVDVLDGKYAHQEGIGASTIRELHRANRQQTDIHLMVNDPIQVCRDLPSGFGRITIQVGTDDLLESIIKTAKQTAEKVWLAVDETLSLAEATSIANKGALLGVEGVLVMLVSPGVPGQSASPDRIQALRKLRSATKLQLGVDGGVNAENIDTAIDSGATYLVSGRSLMATT